MIISDGSRFVPKDFYPKFSWEVTPQYFMFGDTQRVLLPEEVRSIAARTDFLCIEKSHGLRTLGAAELGAKHEAAAFKKIKPASRCCSTSIPPMPIPSRPTAKGLRADKIDQHPELKKFLLVDPETGELAHRRNVFFFDVLNPELRDGGPTPSRRESPTLAAMEPLSIRCMDFPGCEKTRAKRCKGRWVT